MPHIWCCIDLVEHFSGRSAFVWLQASRRIRSQVVKMNFWVLTKTLQAMRCPLSLWLRRIFISTSRVYDAEICSFPEVAWSGRYDFRARDLHRFPFHLNSDWLVLLITLLQVFMLLIYRIVTLCISWCILADVEILARTDLLLAPCILGKQVDFEILQHGV